MKHEAGKSTTSPGDSVAPCLSGKSTGMAWSILTEISQLLHALSEKGETGSISLRGLPMTDADRLQLEDILGRGEVSVELKLAGVSEVWETSYAGVWWIRHKGAGDKIACEEIAITPIPEILITHPVDIKAAAGRLKSDLGPAREAADLPVQNQETEVEASNV